MVTNKEILNNEKEHAKTAYEVKKLLGIEKRSFDEWWEGEADELEISAFLRTAPQIIESYQEGLNKILALMAKIHMEYPEICEQADLQNAGGGASK